MISSLRISLILKMIFSNFSKLSFLSISTALLLLGNYPVQSASFSGKQNSPNLSIKLAKSTQIKPGQYCFNLETTTLTGKAQVKVNRNNSVTGNISATIHNDQESYYSSYNQSFTGNLKSNQLKVNVITKIEDDTQRSQEIWTLTENSLSTGRETFNKVNCATSLTDGLPSRKIRVKFKPGNNSTVIEDAVVRGTRDIYLINAKAGQKMKISITSLENNAVFNLVSPNQQIIDQEITSKSFTLPASGDYHVVVGGTRGNASYKLRVEIN